MIGHYLSSNNKMSYSAKTQIFSTHSYIQKEWNDPRGTKLLWYISTHSHEHVIHGQSSWALEKRSQNLTNSMRIVFSQPDWWIYLVKTMCRSFAHVRGTGNRIHRFDLLLKELPQTIWLGNMPTFLTAFSIHLLGHSSHDRQGYS